MILLSKRKDLLAITCGCPSSSTHRLLMNGVLPASSLALLWGPAAVRDNTAKMMKAATPHDAIFRVLETKHNNETTHAHRHCTVHTHCWHEEGTNCTELLRRKGGRRMNFMALTHAIMCNLKKKKKPKPWAYYIVVCLMRIRSVGHKEQVKSSAPTWWSSLFSATIWRSGHWQ